MCCEHCAECCTWSSTVQGICLICDMLAYTVQQYSMCVTHCCSSDCFWLWGLLQWTVFSELTFCVWTDMAVLKELFMPDDCSISYTLCNKYKEYNFYVIKWCGSRCRNSEVLNTTVKENYCHHYIPLSILKQSENGLKPRVSKWSYNVGMMYSFITVLCCND